MKILFLSGVDVGGAPRSTLELADHLAARGHDVSVLLGRTALGSGPYELLVRAAAKARARSGRPWLRWAARPFGRAAKRVPAAGGAIVEHIRQPENYLRRALRERQPDVVVVNSFPREQMQWISEDLRRANVPLALYLREEHSVSHLSISGLRPDVVLGNSQHLSQAAEKVGVACVFCPSIVDLRSTKVTSTRTKVVLVNPIPENRPSIMRSLAEKRPDIHCVLQESWPLSHEARVLVDGYAAGCGNLEVRPKSDVGADIYADARFLLATYPSGRPRVVLEAQSNGIPVIGLDQPALREAIGPGGTVLSPGLTDEQWAEEIARLWDDSSYGDLAEAARLHSLREEIQPDAVVSRVEDALRGVVR